MDAAYIKKTEKRVLIRPAAVNPITYHQKRSREDGLSVSSTGVGDPSESKTPPLDAPELWGLFLLFLISVARDGI